MTVDSLSASSTFLFCLIYCWHYLRVHIADMSSFCHRNTHIHTHAHRFSACEEERHLTISIILSEQMLPPARFCVQVCYVSSNFHLFFFFVCVCARTRARTLTFVFEQLKKQACRVNSSLLQIAVFFLLVSAVGSTGTLMMIWESREVISTSHHTGSLTGLLRSKHQSLVK